MAELPFPGCRLVVPAADVIRAWDTLAQRIQAEIDAGPCLLLGVLVGGMVPLVKIAERLRGDFLVDCCHVSRYAGATRGGELRWLLAPRLPMQGQTVIIVDDIFDEGDTTEALRRFCSAAGARRVLCAVLLRKRHGRPLAGREPELAGLEVGDEYVFGCGMDYQERWRHLDAVFAVLPGTALPAGQSG